MSDPVEGTPATEGLTVVVLDGKGAPRTYYHVGAAGAWIGRGPGVDITLDDATSYLSPRHARIDYSEGTFWLTDESAGGTFLNGDPTPLPQATRQRVKVGDIIRIGAYELRLQAGRQQAVETLANLSLPRPAEPWSDVSPPARDMLAELLDGWQLDDVTTVAAEELQEDRKAVPSLTNNPLADIVSDLQRATGAPASTSGLPVFEAPTPLPETTPTPPIPPTQPVQLTRDALDQMTQDALAAAPGTAQALSPAAPQNIMTGAVQDPLQLLLKSDSATAALAAFWWSLGAMPQVQDPASLFHLMSDLGAAFREMTDGLAAQMASGELEPGQAANPFVHGQHGLRRFLNTSGKDGGRLAEWVREGFASTARQQDAAAECIGDAVHKLTQDLGARAIEERVKPLTNGSWRGSSPASYWRLFEMLSDDIGKMAEMRFHQEVDETLRGKRRRASRPVRREPKL